MSGPIPGPPNDHVVTRTGLHEPAEVTHRLYLVHRYSTVKAVRRVARSPRVSLRGPLESLRRGQPAAEQEHVPGPLHDGCEDDENANAPTDSDIVALARYAYATLTPPTVLPCEIDWYAFAQLNAGDQDEEESDEFLGSLRSVP